MMSEQANLTLQSHFRKEDYLIEHQQTTEKQVAMTDESKSADDLTIGEIINREGSRAWFRERFRSDPILNEWRVKDLLDVASQESFFASCSKLPQFGTAQEVHLRRIIHEQCSELDGTKMTPLNHHMETGKGRKSHRNEPAMAIGSFRQLSLSGHFYPCFVSAWKAVYQRAWQLAHFNDFIYIPSSVPEFAKHPDVIRAEVGREVDIDDYIARSSALGASLSAVRSAKGVVLLEEARLDMIFRRTGCYSRLSEQAVAQQRQMLMDMRDIFPLGVKLKICNIEGTGLSCCSVIGDLVTMSVMGGYLVVQSGDLKALIPERCDKAMSEGKSLEAYFSRIQ